jgi:hypothetical protein
MGVRREGLAVSLEEGQREGGACCEDRPELVLVENYEMEKTIAYARVGDGGFDEA